MGWLVGAICAVAACAVDPVQQIAATAPAPDASSPDASPPPPPGMRALSDAPIDAFALAADSSGIYWTTPANELWVLRAEQGAPERLAADAEAGPYCQAPSPPLLAGGFVFWLGSARSALHRTRADGTADDVVIARAVRGDNLAADDANVYWTEVLGSYGQGAGAIRVLPLAAAPGDAPVTLVTAAVNEEIASLAIRDGVLYWTPFGAIGATQYSSTMRRAPVAALTGGDSGVVVGVPSSPSGLFAATDALYFTHFPNLWTTALARLPASGPPVETLVTLPVEQSGEGVAIAGDSLIVTAASLSRGCGSTPSLNLFAAPVDGGPPSLIADQMRTAAIAAPAGIVFVAVDGRLTAMSLDYVRALRIALAP